MGFATVIGPSKPQSAKRVSQAESDNGARHLTGKHWRGFIAQNARFGTVWAKSEMATNQPTGSLTFRNLLARGDIQDGVPHELREPIKRVLAKAFDIAVPPVLGELGFVEARTNAVGLHPFGA